MEEFISTLIKQAAIYTPRVIGALATIIIGLIIIGQLTRILGNMMEKRKVDASLAPFLKSLFNAVLKVLLVISVFSVLGIAMTSFVAIIGAAGLAIGLALSGTLQNFAGGVMLLILKPFKVGDFVEAQGFAGVVKEIQIFHTVMKTPDNKTIIIPNGGLSTASLVNYSTEKYRRVDLTVGIGYGDSTVKAREVLNALIEADDRILRAPEVPADPFIAVSALADSSVNFAVRLWVKASDYWGVTFDMNEKVYNKFNEEGLNIPFPQMDVHVHQS